MADDTNTAEREAFEKWVVTEFPSIDLTREDDGYYKSLADEWWTAFKAGRASLAASAGSEPVAWMVPHLHTFKGATKVHFTRAPGCTMTDAELMDDLEGRVMWLPSTFSDSPGVTDKFGVHHKPKPLYTHPSPPEGMAGWKPIETAPKDGTEILLRSARGRVADGAWGQPDGWANPNCWVWPYINQEPTHWMPIPASEAKEL